MNVEGIVMHGYSVTVCTCAGSPCSLPHNVGDGVTDLEYKVLS